MERSPLEDFVDSVIERAIGTRASDVHFEPFRERFRIRFRIDGVLVEMPDPPARLGPPIVARLKLMSGMSLAERRIPQDGRIRFPAGGRAIDLRASLVPSLHGESIVLRILDGEGPVVRIEDLGFNPRHLDAWRRIIAESSGLVLVTGPTGSGKTTTLYTTLHALSGPGRKIVTIEDPVEYRVPGVNQAQVRPEIGNTFAGLLRAILRQSPNIVMVGEIRDGETAAVALNAALTGHLIFSTLHTRDAVGAIARLREMGVPAFVISSGLRAILSQRLVRRPGGEGRIGVFELVEIDDELRGLIHAGVPESKLRECARRRCPGLRDDAQAKLKGGLTTPEEIASITSHEL